MDEIKKPIIFIIGETASGKTYLAHQLAIRLNGEIVSADSTLVKRELSIGTDKPSKKMLSQVKYHMVDIVSVNDEFSVADYKKLALKAIDSIWKNKKIPIVVGGSGLYLNSIIYNYGFNKNIKNDNLNRKSADELIEIARKNKLNLENLDLRNTRRLANFIRNEGKTGTRGNISNSKIYLLGIRIERASLIENIKRRVDQMIEQGLENEVVGLLSNPEINKEKLNIIGYKEWFSSDKKNSLKFVKESIIKNTKLLAKKQRTWFKNKIDYPIEWVDYPYNLEDIVDALTTFINK